MIHVYFTNNSAEFSSKEWNDHFSALPPQITEDFKRFLRWQDRQAALLGKMLLKVALQQKGYQPDQLPYLQYTPYKRPYLDLPVDFNISHSGQFVVCCLTDKGKAGIDVEEIKPISFHDFEKIMSAEEWKKINTHADPLQSFYTHWALKESVIKADGRGLSLPLDGFKIDTGTAEIAGKTWFIKELQLHTNYCAFLAFDTLQEIKITELSF